MTQAQSHAIVLGGSMAGLCAARVLADHFKRVTIIERDLLDDRVAPRKGVPQGQHLHSLLISGTRVLERLFPGFRNELIARGATPDDIGQARYCIGGVHLANAPSDLEILRMSRPLVESYVRERVRELRNVKVVDGCDVIGVTVVDSAVRGVRMVRRQLKVEQWLPATMVVDATGRGSKLPHWLRDFGFEMPREDRVRVDVGYTSCTYRRPAATQARPGILIGPLAPNTRAGVGAVMEGDRFIVSLIGYLGDYAPTDAIGLSEFARTMPASDLHEIMRDAEPLTKPVPARFPFSQRRYYERLRKFPFGLLAIGDAICSFNPMYAQGMSVAALEADLLDRCLRDYSGDDLRCAYFDGCSAIIDAPWRLTVGADLRFPEVQGARPLSARLRNLYLKRLARAAGEDPEVALAFLRVTNLVNPPSSLFAPRIATRVAAHAFTRRNSVPQLSAATNATDPA
jgi:2-polyprenyl-6-methoxyphenol hydroxylase-like FAD-dependent oxidoreductase